MKAVFLAWEKHHARTLLLGRALGAQVHFISRLGRVSGARLLLKYLWQSADTVAFLAHTRPEVILVQTPPIFPALIAAAYARLFPRTRVILDAHSGTFLSRKWRWALPLHRWCSRRAQMTIVHMRSLLPVVRGWGAPVMEMGYVFEAAEPPTRSGYRLPPGTNIAVPSSFNQDEPLELIFAAAQLLPDVHFHLTGDARRVPPAVLARRPANVVFTGYLALDDYFGLLRSADAVLALTTQDQTFQTGGAEAVWLSRPLLISDWPELRQVFARGSVFVDHTPAGLAAGVRAAQAQSAELQRDMRQLKQEFDRELQNRIRTLLAIMVSDRPARRSPVRGTRARLANDKENVV